MYTLSLDLSTKSSGFAVFENKKLIEFGCLTASSTDVIKRIYKIIGELSKIVDKYPIDTVLIEEVRPEDLKHSGKNLHTQKVLMWLQAAVVFLLHDKRPKAKIEYIYPSSWRSGVGIHTGRGIKREGLKPQDISFVKENYGIDVNDDIADSICIGHYYLNKKETTLSWE